MPAFASSKKGSNLELGTETLIRIQLWQFRPSLKALRLASYIYGRILDNIGGSFE